MLNLYNLSQISLQKKSYTVENIFKRHTHFLKNRPDQCCLIELSAITDNIPHFYAVSKQ